MRRVIVPVLLVVAAALGCGKQSAPAQRNQPQYDVVEEGQNGSATSTISAPGETQPPTTTANDTTGTFALGTAMPPANMPGGPTSGVMPPQPQAQPAPMASGMPAPPPTTTQPQPPPRPRRQPQPIVVNTTTTTATSDTSDTTETTDTAPPPQPQPQQPPPPPTVTDTIGGHR